MSIGYKEKNTDFTPLDKSMKTQVDICLLHLVKE